MRKHGSRAAALPLSLLLVVIQTTFTPAQTGPRQPRRAHSTDVVLFDTTGYGGEQIILPIVIVRGGRFLAPPAFNMRAARRRFAASYYRPGQKYRLLESGGGEGGTVTVKRLQTCDPTAAYVEVQPRQAAGGRRLATSSDAFGGRPVGRRELTEAEQTEIMKLVDPPFRRGGYGEPSITGVSSVAEAADLDGDGKSELIGTFTTGAKSQHSLFVIAEPGVGGFRPGLLLFTPATDELGDDSVSHYLLEAIDLDGDRIAEAIATVNDYRSPDDWYYVIYKKQGGRWRSVYRGGGFRCPDDSGGH